MDDPTLISKQQLFARIVGGLGGRAAEEVIFGDTEVTTGAAGDLQQITSLAKQVSEKSSYFPFALLPFFFFSWPKENQELNTQVVWCVKI